MDRKSKKSILGPFSTITYLNERRFGEEKLRGTRIRGQNQPTMAKHPKFQDFSKNVGPIFKNIPGRIWDIEFCPTWIFFQVVSVATKNEHKFIFMPLLLDWVASLAKLIRNCSKLHTTLRRRSSNFCFWWRRFSADYLYSNLGIKWQ